MDKLKKTLALVRSELKCNTGGETVIILMLTVMMICSNIMISAISNYAGALIYLMNPNAQNAVSIYNNNMLKDFSEIKNSSDVEYGIEINAYNAGGFCDIIAVSEELFSEELSFLSKSNIDAIKNYADGDRVPLLVNRGTGFNVGQTGEIMGEIPDVTIKYEIVGIIDNEEIKHLLFSVIGFTEYAIAPYSEQFASLSVKMNPTMFSKLSDGTDKKEFKEKIKADGFSASDFDPFRVLSGQFSNSIILSVIGALTFTISLFGVIINCYLVFGSKRKYYRALMTVGGKKKTFLRCAAIVKAFQLLVSLVISVGLTVLLNMTMDNESFNILGVLLSAAFGALLIGLTYLLLSRWLGKLSCLEN